MLKHVYFRQKWIRLDGRNRFENAFCGRYIFFEMERNFCFQIKTETLGRVLRRVGEYCSYVFHWSVGNQIIIKVAIAHSKPTIVLVCHTIVTLLLRFSKWT